MPHFITKLALSLGPGEFLVTRQHFGAYSRAGRHCCFDDETHGSTSITPGFVGKGVLSSTKLRGASNEQLPRRTFPNHTRDLTDDSPSTGWKHDTVRGQAYRVSPTSESSGQPGPWPRRTSGSGGCPLKDAFGASPVSGLAAQAGWSTRPVWAARRHEGSTCRLGQKVVFRMALRLSLNAGFGHHLSTPPGSLSVEPRSPRKRIAGRLFRRPMLDFGSRCV